MQVCCICLAKYADNDNLRELPCSHFFHMECVDKWLKINALCPLCKCEVGDSSEASPSASNLNQRHGERRMGNASAEGGLYLWALYFSSWTIKPQLVVLEVVFSTQCLLACQFFFPSEAFIADVVSTRWFNRNFRWGCIVLVECRIQLQSIGYENSYFPQLKVVKLITVSYVECVNSEYHPISESGSIYSISRFWDPLDLSWTVSWKSCAISMCYCIQSGNGAVFAEWLQSFYWN